LIEGWEIFPIQTITKTNVRLVKPKKEQNFFPIRWVFK
jgi:hypothetical protein